MSRPFYLKRARCSPRADSVRSIRSHRESSGYLPHSHDYMQIFGSITPEAAAYWVEGAKASDGLRRYLHRSSEGRASGGVAGRCRDHQLRIFFSTIFPRRARTAPISSRCTAALNLCLTPSVEPMTSIPSFRFGLNGRAREHADERDAGGIRKRRYLL